MKSEKFEQLEQLDRIEYLLEKEGNKSPSLVSVSFLYIILFLMILVATLGFIVYFNTGSTSIIDILYVTYPIIQMGFLFCVALDLLCISGYLLKSNKIEKKYLKRGGFQ